MKRKDGESFSLSTLACKRAAIHRYILKTIGVAIIGNVLFKSFDKTFNAVQNFHIRRVMLQ